MKIKPNTYYKRIHKRPYNAWYYITNDGMIYYKSDSYPKWDKSIFSLEKLQTSLNDGRIIEVPYMNTALYKLLFKDTYESKT